MIYKISLTLETADPEAVIGMKELLAMQAQQYGDVGSICVQELPYRQTSLFDGRAGA